jgi:ATP-binding cassette subfamily B protein
MWRLCRLGYSREPGCSSRRFSLALLSALPDALLAVWFKLLGDGVLNANWRLVRIAAVALGVSAIATWFLRTVSAGAAPLSRQSDHCTRVASSAAGIHRDDRPQERSGYLDRLAVLRDQVFMLDHVVSLFSTCGWILRLGVTVALLMSIHPALALLAVFAVPTVLTSTWRPGVERTAYERGAPSGRLARHLFNIATTATPGKEVRVTGIGDRLMRERRLAWERCVMVGLTP